MSLLLLIGFYLLLLGLPILEILVLNKKVIKINRPFKFYIVVTTISFLLLRLTNLIGKVQSSREFVNAIVTGSHFYYIAGVILFTNILLIGIWWLIRKNFTFQKLSKARKNGVALFICALTLIILATADHISQTYGKVTTVQLIFNLTNPATGASREQFLLAIYNPVLNCTLAIILVSALVSQKYKFSHENKIYSPKIISRILKTTMVFLLINSVLIFDYTFKVMEFVKSTFTPSEFIVQNYVDPNQTSITSPTQKRNLIHIYVESLESSMTNIENGGLFEVDYIPLMTKLAQENINFTQHSNPNLIGGNNSIDGTNWTAAGMTATELGIPIKVDPTNNLEISNEAVGQNGNFYNSVIGLGDILEQDGYSNHFYIGSDANFASRNVLMRNHGNYQITDLHTLRNSGLVPEDYFVNWGIEDNKLFTGAEEYLTNLANNDQPFNFTLLTTDLHAPHGYIDPVNPLIYDTAYENAMYYGEREVAQFVEWCMQQPWFENTTIVITGDHISMNSYLMGPLATNDRYVYNAFINPAVAVDETSTYNRDFAQFDYFPTILSALGYQIEGEKLGLGTNLFSGEKTLFEEYGHEFVVEELKKKSLFYNNEIANPTENKEFDSSNFVSEDEQTSQ